MLTEFMATEARQLSETLAFQSATYMKAAWQVTGEPKKDKLKVVDTEKLDYELFDRWLLFLEKRPVFYPFLKDWQALVARGGTAKEAGELAVKFQDLLIGVMLEQRELKKENDIIKARALPTSKPKEPANLPNEFKTNDDFCPGCGLELRSMTTERTALWGDVFRANLDPDDAPGKPERPGLLHFSGWGLEQRLGGDRRALIEGLRKDIAAMAKALPTKYAYVHGVRELETTTDLQVHLRGNPMRLGDSVPRGFLTVLSNPAERVTFTKGSGRLDLARTIASQPVALRVIVNRVWKEHFGTGLVNTPSNFGVNGERPTHPELLDYLAQYFVDHGLSIKALHREIMRSAVYQLSADHQAAAFAKDSGNRLYWRANRHRMSAEQIRDSVLYVSGALDERLGGPSQALTPLGDRRTIYGRVSRYKLDEFLQLFDFPSPSQTAEQRFSTNVPLQRLFFMNSDFVQQHAERVAEQVADEPDDPARIEKVYRRLFGRSPTADEVKAGREFLQAEALKQHDERRAAAAKAEKAPPVPEPEPADAAAESGASEVDRRATRRRDDGGRGTGRQGQRRREGEDAAGHDVRPLREDPAEFERVPVRELTHVAPITARPSPAAKRCAASATASACWRLPAWSASRCPPPASIRRRPYPPLAKGLHHPARAKHVIFLFMNGGLSQVDSFDPKPMLEKYHGQPLPGGTVATERKTGSLMKSPFAFKKYGKSGLDVSELFPLRRRLRRRHLRDPLDAHRHPESRTVDADDEHRPHPGGPAVDRLVAHLRPRHREQEPAGLRRAVPGHADHRRPAAVEQRVPAGDASGHLHPEQGRAAGPDRRQGLRSEEARLLHQQQGVHAAGAAARAGPAGLARSDAARQRARRSAAGGRDQLDGSGLPDADRGARCVRHPQGEPGHARAVRAGQHRARLPDGGAAGRARRADGAGLLRQGRSVGCPLRHPAAPQERQGLGPAVRRGDQGPEVTRPLQGHAGRLRLGVRPHAGRRGGRRWPARRAAAITTRSASACGWPAAA